MVSIRCLVLFEGDIWLGAGQVSTSMCFGLCSGWGTLMKGTVACKCSLRFKEDNEINVGPILMVFHACLQGLLI